MDVTQQDLQRELHQARQNAAHPHRLPTLALPKDMPSAGLLGVRQALEATRHLLEMFRRQLGDEKIRRRLWRLDKRLLSVSTFPRVESVLRQPICPNWRKQRTVLPVHSRLLTRKN